MSQTPPPPAPAQGFGVRPSRTSRGRSSSSGGSSPSPASSSADELFKTELCRSFESTGVCKYGPKCRFAHGSFELRPVARHPKCDLLARHTLHGVAVSFFFPFFFVFFFFFFLLLLSLFARYKTQHCKTFREQGHCPYGARCKFIHSDQDESAASAPGQLERLPLDVVLAGGDRFFRDKRAQSVDSSQAAGEPSSSSKSPSSSGQAGLSPRSPLGSMSPFQELSPRSPEVLRRGNNPGKTDSPRGAFNSSPRSRGHAQLVAAGTSEDPMAFAFVQRGGEGAGTGAGGQARKKEKQRLPIFKDIVDGGVDK